MKKLSMFAMLLSLGLFAAGCSDGSPFEAGTSTTSIATLRSSHFGTAEPRLVAGVLPIIGHFPHLDLGEANAGFPR